MPGVERMSRSGRGNVTRKITAALDQLNEFFMLVLKLLMRLFAWPVCLIRNLAGGGGRPRADDTAAEEKARRQQELDQPEPKPEQGGEITRADRLVPLMKEYLRTTDETRRLDLGRRLDEAAVRSYIDHLSDGERSAFLLTPANLLRKHFAGTVPVEALPAWEGAKDYGAGSAQLDAPMVFFETTEAPVRSKMPSGETEFRNLLQQRTALLMQRRRRTQGRGVAP